MSGVKCNYCGKIRKVEQVFSSDGWHNPECWNCHAPGWTETDNDPFNQPPPAGVGFPPNPPKDAAK